MHYHSHYTEKTFITIGTLTNVKDMVERERFARSLGINVIGECWVEGYGFTALWQGPEISEDDQLLLSIKSFDFNSCKMYENSVPVVPSQVPVLDKWRDSKVLNGAK